MTTEKDDNVVRRLDHIESGLGRLESAVARLADAMVQLARLEVSMTHNGDAITRAFSAIEKLASTVEQYERESRLRMKEHEEKADERLKKLEEAQPVQKLVSGWVLAWIAGAVGLLGGAVATAVLLNLPKAADHALKTGAAGAIRATRTILGV